MKIICVQIPDIVKVNFGCIYTPKLAPNPRNYRIREYQKLDQNIWPAKDPPNSSNPYIVP